MFKIFFCIHCGFKCTATVWSTFNVNNSAQSFTPNKRFYMHSAFSRYIRPGATFVTINNNDSVAALSADGSALTIVVRNGDTSATHNFTYDLTSLPSIGSSVQVYRTSRTENLAQMPAVAISNWSFTAALPPYSITTFVVPL